MIVVPAIFSEASAFVCPWILSAPPLPLLASGLLFANCPPLIVTLKVGLELALLIVA